MAAAQTNGAQQFMRGLSGLMESVQGGSAEEGLAGWAKYQLNVSRNVAGVYLKADALKLAHDGDSKDGSIHIQLLGMQMGNPYVATKGPKSCWWRMSATKSSHVPSWPPMVGPPRRTSPGAPTWRCASQ